MRISLFAIILVIAALFMPSPALALSAVLSGPNSYNLIVDQDGILGGQVNIELAGNSFESIEFIDELLVIGTCNAEGAQQLDNKICFDFTAPADSTALSNGNKIATLNLSQTDSPVISVSYLTQADIIVTSKTTLPTQAPNEPITNSSNHTLAYLLIGTSTAVIVILIIKATKRND